MIDLSNPLRAFAAAAALAFSALAPGPVVAAEAEDAALRAAIELRLAERGEGGGEGITVRVQQGHVVLLGRVPLLEHALRAEQLTWTTPGVVDVDNELRVTSVEPGGDRAIEREVRLVLKADGRFEDTQLDLSVRSGVVVLRGTFHNPIDVLTLKHRIAAIPGVRDLRIDAILLARSPPAAVRAA